MTLGALSLGPEDPCYDQSHPWYYPNVMSTAAECECMQANFSNYTAGQQCVGYCVEDPSAPIAMQCVSAGGVAQTMLAPAGAAVGAAASAIGQGIGQGLGAGLKGFGGAVDFTGLVLLGVAGFVAYALLSKR
jgi:hypothetical protein